MTNRNPNFLLTVLFTDQADFTREGIYNFRSTITIGLKKIFMLFINHVTKFKVNVRVGMISDNLIGFFFIEGSLTQILMQNKLPQDLEEISPFYLVTRNVFS